MGCNGHQVPCNGTQPKRGDVVRWYVAFSPLDYFRLKTLPRLMKKKKTNENVEQKRPCCTRERE
jgi:hypothetical protein